MSSDSIHLCDYPCVATDVPTFSDAMSSHFSSASPLCDSRVAATAPVSSDSIHLCDYPCVATNVPTSSDAMSSSDDFPDIHEQF